MQQPSPVGNTDIDSALSDATQRFVAANPLSQARHVKAARSLPGGNTRGVLYYKPFPVTLVGGEGTYVTDLDGHLYVDLISEYTAGLYGHSDPVIAEALTAAVKGGTALGAPNTFEARYGAALIERFPALERVRFCNSGTEANIMAISAARAIAGRSKVMVFREGYHGGVLTFAHGGSPLNLPFPYIFADYNDVAGTKAAIAEHGQDLAVVILEQMMGAGGCIQATAEFLRMLRVETQRVGAFLIFDEVMTSRLHFRGLHGANGITPDFATFGKYLGGGASFGCFGGRADLMDRFDPSTPKGFSHGGTFNNNILSMMGGYAGFTQVLTEEAVTRVNELGDRLRMAMNQAIARHGVAASVIGRGSLMNLHFVAGSVTTPADLAGADPRLMSLWQLEMLLAGYHVTPRGMLALSLPFGDDEARSFVAAFDEFLAIHRNILPRVA